MKNSLCLILLNLTTFPCFFYDDKTFQDFTDMENIKSYPSQLFQ